MASNVGYAIGNNKWFIGQVPPGFNEYVQKGSESPDQHGDRVKVRIPGMHPMSGDDATDLQDKDLPWAIVAKPTTHGNRNAISSGIWGGEWVIGFFMDEDCQIPVITQVLTNNNQFYQIRESTNGTTLGKRVDVYNTGRSPGNLVTGAPKPSKPAVVDVKKLSK